MRTAIFIILFLPSIVFGDCYDFSVALPGQVYTIKGDNPTNAEIFFGEQQNTGFCPSGLAELRWTETLPTGHYKERSLPLNYITQEGNPWILIPNLALGLLIDKQIILIPLNTPLLVLENSFSDTQPMPWGTW